MTEKLGFGFKVGHWTAPDVSTGCTVVLPPRGNVASCDVRGSSPSSRELAHLDLKRRLTEVHAVLLTGGSAFGLAAADGVMTWLAERGIGYATSIGPIPIVPAAVIFDPAAARPEVRPGPDQGRAACDDARDTKVPTGRVGAGAGSTVGKWAGLEFMAPGGLGIAHASAEGMEVAALAVVNAVGDVVGDDGAVLAGSSAPPEALRAPRPPKPTEVPGNTVLAVVALRGRLAKADVNWLASRGSDGIAQAVRPAHTRYDGDVVFAVAAPPEPGGPAPDLDLLGVLATEAVSGAVRNAVAG